MEKVSAKKAVKSAQESVPKENVLGKQLLQKRIVTNCKYTTTHF